jgi:hypothetical protein
MLQLQGSQDGVTPDDGDVVKSVTLSVSGVSKLILGPQILKVALYDGEDFATNTKIAGPIEIVSSGSDSPSSAKQITFTAAELGASATYGVFKDAWISIWAENP